MRKLCQPCGRPFEAKSELAKYCSGRCRTKAHRNKSTAEVVALPGASAASRPAAEALGLEETVRAELVKAKRETTALGVNVLKLARRLDNASIETGAAYAALEKAFRAAYAEALADAEEEADELDKLRASAGQTLRVVSAG